MSNENKCLVIGYGSIGKRHVNILQSLGCQVSVVSTREIDFSSTFSRVKEAIIEIKPNYIIVANETHKHLDTLREIEEIGYNQKILVEKPLFEKKSNKIFLFDEMYIGYNLRFHPLIQALHKELKGQKIVSVQAYVGQYLPTWRPNTDYKDSYSASKAKGGGVLRDLSHELDYLYYLFGEWVTMTALGGKFSDLNINTDDHFSITYNTEKVPLINVQMNYLDFITQRFIIINTTDKTYKADLIQNTLQVNGEITNVKSERNDTYTLQHLALLNNEVTELCQLEDGLKIINMIEKVETASRKKVWITNE